MQDIRLDHLKAIMGPYGLYQHATIREPFLSEGYCTDDNARAISTLLRLRPFLKKEQPVEIDEVIDRCWEFVTAAQITPEKYYNFRRADGDWLPTEESEDMYARLIRCFTATDAKKFLEPLLQRALTFQAPRAIAETALADSSLPVLNYAGQFLRKLWQQNSAPDWPWFEDTMTYANAIFPHGILNILRHQPNQELEIILRESTKFLIKSTLRDQMFIPIGSEGWYPRGGTPSRGNQQPIEAGLTFDFLIDYANEIESLDYAIIAAPYLWLYGKNTHNFSLVDLEHGSCRDGLRASGPNLNCGAESLLAYLWAEARLREAPPELQEHIVAEKHEIDFT